MTLSMEVNGIVYNDALSIEVVRSINNFPAYFYVRSSANINDRLPVKVGDAVNILADGTQIFNGFIEDIGVSYDSSSHTISISGRERVADIVDSTVTGNKVFTGPINFKDVIRQVLDAGNMQDIDIIDETGVSLDFAAGERLEAEVGQTIFNFLEPYASKLQVIISSDEAGNLLLLRAGQEHSGLSLVNGENILSASLSKNTAYRFNEYIARAQLNPLSDDNASIEDVSSQVGSSGIDDEIRTSRILEFNVEEDMTSEQSEGRAQFEANIRRVNSVKYTCKVQGHSVNGKPFKINTLASVNDSFCGISADLLIHSITYKLSLNGGSTSALSMTNRDAYTLQAIQDAREAARELTGDGF